VTQLSLTAADVATAAGGHVVSGDPSTPVVGVSIDSRTLAPGDFFIAIRGERFDGHAFVADVLAKGAAGVVVEKAGRGGGTAAIIEVTETTRALQDLARFVRRQSGARIVAITGSAGKTTTKEICAEMLSAKYRVFRNKGNLNNHIGLPLSLLELRSGPEVAVVELGMNHPGEISTLVGIAQP
jgi:UDP-N-acetylmuramoyl-tripeptide--D-alanyl-D-alanine ligase